jgi:hypothetical protein
MKDLITAADIKARTVANLNVENHKLNVIIQLTQKRHLRPLLGVTLYDALVAFADTAPAIPPTNATTLEKTAYAEALAQWRAAATADPLLALLDECKEMLCAWALVEAKPGLLGHIEDAGFTTKVGSGDTGTSTADVRLTEETFAAFADTAVFHGTELAAWLCDPARAANYPTYEPNTPDSTGEGAFAGIYLG